MVSERPSVPWLRMHWTSRAGASAARTCAAWLLVGDATGGGGDEQAAAAHAMKAPVIAQARDRRRSQATGYSLTGLRGTWLAKEFMRLFPRVLGSIYRDG